jgi:dolichol-phosphate mannosyltransferase
VKFSVVIPARNEEDSVGQTVAQAVDALVREGVDYEIVVVDDGSSDRTASAVANLAASDPRVRCVSSPYRDGYGFAVRAGLEQYTGDAVAIMMADGSDDPEDLISYYRLLAAGYECVFGSRFIHGGTTRGYPLFKLILNRIVNFGIRMAFGHGYDDTTNAFKAYRREVIDNIQPLISHHFNLTVEMPLKAIVRGHSYAVTPVSWTNRRSGSSKLRLQEMGSRYLFIILYVFFEHHLSRGDYRRSDGAARGGDAGWRTGGPAARVHTQRQASEGGGGIDSADEMPHAPN